ncbi:hypothetical protein [Spiroplasma chrysopicola]|uniref:Transmembrane protein n=1 Tax=Spiroplasma chrysopicola DF-1 TaxID=1276227 RepID=R4U0Y5_9MOLU|nr:hypothetical protein [Spiroplasma chrysopicola]AGM24967.1 hypothetical protein SCHRY_v1c03840 [Spiroplasma chrysopicola DF-1]
MKNRKVLKPQAFDLEQPANPSSPAFTCKGKTIRKYFQFHFAFQIKLNQIIIMAFLLALNILFQYLSNIMVITIYPFDIILVYIPFFIIGYLFGFLKTLFFILAFLIISFLTWPPYLAVWETFILNTIFLNFIFAFPCLIFSSYSVQDNLQQPTTITKIKYFSHVILIMLISWIITSLGLSIFVIKVGNPNDYIHNNNSLFQGFNGGIFAFAFSYQLIRHLINTILYLSIFWHLYRIIDKYR